MSLTKASSSMVWWSLPDIRSQGTGFTLAMQFAAVLQARTVAQSADASVMVSTPSTTKR